MVGGRVGITLDSPTEEGVDLILEDLRLLDRRGKEPGTLGLDWSGICKSRRKTVKVLPKGLSSFTSRRPLFTRRVEP